MYLDFLQSHVDLISIEIIANYDHYIINYISFQQDGTHLQYYALTMRQFLN